MKVILKISWDMRLAMPSNLHKQRLLGKRKKFQTAKTGLADCIFFILLLSIGLSLLARVLWFEFAGIYLEEIHRLLWVLASNIVESASGDIVRLTVSHQRIVF
jgi:hypothetical protein